LNFNIIYIIIAIITDIINRIELLLKEELEEDAEEDSKKAGSAIIPKEFRTDIHYKMPYMNKLYVKMGKYPIGKVKAMWKDFVEEVTESKKDGNLLHILNTIFKRPKIKMLKPLVNNLKPEIFEGEAVEEILNLATRLSYSLSLSLGTLTAIQPISIIISLMYFSGIIGEEQGFKDIMMRANKVTRSYMKKPGEEEGEDYTEE
jgi:hypothetical protein